MTDVFKRRMSRIFAVKEGGRPEDGWLYEESYIFAGFMVGIAWLRFSRTIMRQPKVKASINWLVNLLDGWFESGPETPVKHIHHFEKIGASAYPGMELTTHKCSICHQIFIDYVADDEKKAAAFIAVMHGVDLHIIEKDPDTP